MTPISKLLSLAVLALAAFSAHAQWKFIDETDAMTDAKIKVAMIIDLEEGILSLTRTPGNGPVVLSFQLVREASGISDEPIMVRFDKHPAHTLGPKSNTESAIERPFWHWQPNKVMVQVWDGQGTPNSSSFLRQLSTSSKLLLRYQRTDGRSRDVEFSLVGAKDAVSRAVENQPGPVQGPAFAETAQGKKFGAVWKEAVTRCQKQADAMLCLNKIMPCIYTAKRDPDALLACTGG